MAALAPAGFNRLLKSLGQQVAWRRASLCPCRDAYSGAAQQGCPACAGRGVIWGDAVDAWTGVSGQKSAREWAAFGLWESGDQVLTIPADSPLYGAGEFDRIVMVQSSEPFSVVLAPATDHLSFPIEVIDRVVWLRPDTGAVVEAGIPAVGADGTLTWPDPVTAPDPGVQVSLSGRKHPEFFVFSDLPQDRAHCGGLALPRKVAARRFDLFGR